MSTFESRLEKILNGEELSKEDAIGMINGVLDETLDNKLQSIADLFKIQLSTLLWRLLERESKRRL